MSRFATLKLSLAAAAVATVCFGCSTSSYDTYSSDRNAAQLGPNGDGSTGAATTNSSPDDTRHRQ